MVPHQRSDHRVPTKESCQSPGPPAGEGLPVFILSHTGHPRLPLLANKLRNVPALLSGKVQGYVKGSAFTLLPFPKQTVFGPHSKQRATQKPPPTVDSGR